VKLPQGLIASLPLHALDREGYTKVPTSGDVGVLLYFQGDRPMAVWDLCPHMGAPLGQEDLDALKYRAKLFGRSNIAAYLAAGQFLYHKDDFVKHYGAANRPCK
jgi:hypothetical protein